MKGGSAVPPTRVDVYIIDVAHERGDHVIDVKGIKRAGLLI
jgi:hypothetical protein